MDTIIVVGAGITGLITARHLREMGCAVVLYDKGRRAGGRLASRETVHGSFDHGAQYLRRPAAARPLLHWPAVDAGPEGMAWTGAPTMNHYAQALAEDLDIRCQHTLTGLHRVDAGWQLQFAERDTRIEARQVLLTLPAPQACPLLEAPVAEPLRDLRYRACWTLMWVPDTATLPAAPVWRSDDDAVLAWIAREDLKPGRGGEPRYTVQASAEWSDAHLELTADEAADRLVGHAAARLGIGTASRYAVAHRWRYAFSAQASERCWIQLTSGLWYAGDALIGSRLTDILAAGRRIAAAVHRGH